MSQFLQHTGFYDNPIRLTKEEIADPLKVIDRFFWGFPLSEVRDIIWLSLTALICRKGHSTKYDPEDLLCFYEQFEKMVEATVILMNNNKEALPKP